MITSRFDEGGQEAGRQVGNRDLVVIGITDPGVRKRFYNVLVLDARFRSVRVANV